MLKRFASVSVLALLVQLVMASGADAFTRDKRTYFTFSQPVALPGVTLPAGTYLFRLADPDTTRRVVQVSDRNGTEHFAMLLTTPAYRLEPAQDSQIRFLETAAGAPQAIDAWWYAGDSTGYQFAYSTRQLAELNRVGQPEPAAANRDEAPGRADDEPVVVPPMADPNTPGVIEGEGLPPETTGEADVDAEPEPQAQAQPPVEPPAQPPFESDPAVARDREELPQTASPLGLILLTGLASGGLGLKLLRQS